jgi:hypothetical protein
MLRECLERMGEQKKLFSFGVIQSRDGDRHTN